MTLIMKTYIKYPLIFLGVLFSLWIIGRLTNTFQFYQSPTPANEPAIKSDSRFFASNLVHPKLLNFVCFYATDETSGRQLRTFRICGTEGDVLEIKNGDLFVNRKNFDDQIEVQHSYRLSRQVYEKVKNSMQIDEASVIQAGGDLVIVPMTKRLASINNLTSSRIVLSKNLEDEEIFKTFSQHWNLDNFGPIKVPAGKYFVLGDNRHNALDSRYLGFVDKSDIVATVLWKK